MKKRIKDLLKAGEENVEEYGDLYRKPNDEPNKIQGNKKNDVGESGVNSNSREQYGEKGGEVVSSSIATKSQGNNVIESMSGNNVGSKEREVVFQKEKPNIKEISGTGKKVYQEIKRINTKKIDDKMSDSKELLLTM